MVVSRRDVLKAAAVGGAVAALPTRVAAAPAPPRARVFVVRESDRGRAVAACFMTDLHRSEHQRAMIAEANLAWRPAFNVMDCLEAFVDGGPEQGRRAAPGVFLASDDRCALDAAAIALLRLSGMTGPAARGPIGQTAQLARALALGLGARPEQVEVVPIEPGARDVARRLAELLAAG